MSQCEHVWQIIPYITLFYDMFTAMENGYRHLPVTYDPFASYPQQAFSSLKQPGKSCGTTTRCVSSMNGVLVSIIYKKKLY